jgi:predicted ferric reductase
MPASIHVEQLLGSGMRSPATPGASARFTMDRRKIIIGITLTAVIVSVIRLAAYIHYSAKLKDASPPVESLPDIPLQTPFPAYWAAIYYLATMIAAFVGYKWYTGLLQQRLEQQREQFYLRSIPYSVMDTLSYRYLETSISIPFVTTSTSLRSVLVVLTIVTLNLICTTWPHSPNQLEQANRAGYLAVANFSLLIPLSIRSFPWMALDTAISWHRVFGMLAFVCAAQHGCYHFSERLESLKPIMESRKQITGLFSIFTMATMILASHELVRTSRYALFRTVHLSAFLMLIISLSIHKRAFLLVNVFGIVWWAIGRVWRKNQSAAKLVRIQNSGKFTQVTLEYPFKTITAGQFAYLGVTGAGFSKPGWARPFSFSGIHTQKSTHSPVLQEKNMVKANATTLSSAHEYTETHHRPAFHHEPSTTQVPDGDALNIGVSRSTKDHETVTDSPKSVDMHVQARGQFTSSLFKAAGLQDPESHSSSQIRLELDGPYGAPWLSLSKHYYSDFETVVLVCSGAGITPWIAVMQAMVASANQNRTRHIHVIWLIHDIGEIYCIALRIVVEGEVTKNLISDTILISYL